MRLRLNSLAVAFVLTFSTILLSGCGQLHQIALLFNRPSLHMPARPTVDVTYLDQNWTPVQRQWFDHAGQGAQLMPYKWFMALEQPSIKPFGTVGLFSDRAYLAGFGFFPDAPGPNNPDGLPVGFTQETVTEPDTGETVQVAGLTCAACHTGQLEYKGKGIRIEGGNASVDPVAFQVELSYAFALTEEIPFRFNRFAKRVLGDNASPEDVDDLRKRFKAALAKGLAEKNAADAAHLYDVNGGFGRTDALARIGNYVFGTEFNSDANLARANAPVKLPPIWTTSWFGWVQYNNSIQQPMMRNIGEAMGVRAAVDFLHKDKLYRSTINTTNLWKMEEQLAGPTAFNGLRAPAWPSEIFGPIDQAKARQGAELYHQLCERCHLPPIDSPAIQDAQYWEPGQEGHRYLKLKTSDLDEIGTDPRQATDWAERTADASLLGLGKVPATVGLRAVTASVRDLSYKDLGLTPALQQQWSGYRDDGVTAPLAYKARTLEGMWATPPFLHNGSVPNMYELLLPAAQRSKTFWVGSREFDPVRLGFSTSQIPNGFLFDTTTTGNSNAGHEFSNTPGKGVIGPELTDEQRWQIIEYLKTLDSSTQTASITPAPASKPAACRPCHT